MKFISYRCEFVGKINEIHILIITKSNRDIPGFFIISRDISWPKIEPGSRELNPTEEPSGEVLGISDANIFENLSQLWEKNISNLEYQNLQAY